MPFSAYPAIVLPGVLSVMAPDPAVPAVPLVFDSPHSGVKLPVDFTPAVDKSWVLKATDTHVEALWAQVPKAGASLLRAEFPRSFVDVNRAETDIDPELLDAPWPGPVSGAESVKRGMGLIWRYAWGEHLMYDGKLGVEEVTARIAHYYRPYHAILARLLDDAHQRWGQVWYIDCHSMPSQGHRLSPDAPGAARADIVLGDRDGTSCAPELLIVCAEHFQSRGYSVAINDPFKGAELVRRHGNPAHHRHALQIELNRRLYMDEETRARSAGFGRLQQDCTDLAHALALFVMARL